MKKIFSLCFILIMIFNVNIFAEGIYTLNSEQIAEINVTGGEGKTAINGYKIQYSTIFRAAIEFQDVSNNISTVFVRYDNSAVEVFIKADQLYNLGRAPHFSQIGDDIYYRVGNQIRVLTIDENDIVTDNLFLLGNQIAINENGDMMMENGSVYFRETNGILTEMGATYPVKFPNQNWTMDLQVRKFFFESLSGFLAKRPDGSFVRIYKENDEIITRDAQDVAWEDWFYGGGSVPVFVKDTSQASNCYTVPISDQNILVCGGLRTYQIGDASNDIKSLGNIMSGFSSNGALLSASDSWLYVSSNYANGTPNKLSRISLSGVSIPIITGLYNYLIQTTRTINGSDVHRFCGIRYSDGVPVIGEILNSDTTPDVTIIESTCSNLITF
jgi:hypothetical protein